MCLLLNFLTWRAVHLFNFSLLYTPRWKYQQEQQDTNNKHNNFCSLSCSPKFTILSFSWNVQTELMERESEQRRKPSGNASWDICHRPKESLWGAMSRNFVHEMKISRLLFSILFFAACAYIYTCFHNLWMSSLKCSLFV